MAPRGAFLTKNARYANDVAELVSAGFLKSVPNNAEYTIGYTVDNSTTPKTSTVTGDLAGGATTTNCSA